MPNITYADGFWTITGLFDIGKTYTISEPAASVPDNNIQAKDFSFTMGADGAITIIGPTRMDYRRVVTLLDVMRNSLSQAFFEQKK